MRKLGFRVGISLNNKNTIIAINIYILCQEQFTIFNYPKEMILFSNDPILIITIVIDAIIYLPLLTFLRQSLTLVVQTASIPSSSAPVFHLLELQTLLGFHYHLHKVKLKPN